MRTTYLIGSAMAVALGSQCAYAQEAAPAEFGASGIQEIIVTAQRKQESSQKAGIPIDVIGADALLSKGVSTAAGLNTLVPSLSVQSGGGANTTFFVRGVGNFTVNGYSDPAVAFNYDGVYLGRPTSTSGMFYDLERVEVLKGPQGTLYGRNATAGAINVLPAKPKIGEWSGKLIGSYGNFNAVSVQGAINAPLGDHGAVRLSGNIVSRDGYLSDGTSNEKGEALRFQMLGELTPDLTVRVAMDYSHTGGKGDGASYAGKYAFNPVAGSYTFVPSGFDNSVGLFDPASQAYRQTLFLGVSGRTAAPLDPDVYLDNAFYGAHAEITWKTGIGTLTVQPAFRTSKLDNKFGVPGFIGYIQEKDRQFSLEARLAVKPVGIFDAIIGGYYFDETVNGNYTFAQQALNAYQEFKADTRSYAAFGRVTANLTDHFRAIGGVRYTHDAKDFNGQADVLIVRCTVVVMGRPSCPTVPLLPVTDSFTQLQPPFIIPPAGQVRPIGATGAILIRATTPVNATLPKSKVTYHAGLEYDIAPQSLVYATVKSGYRSGGFSLSAGFETYQPEYITAYTIGSKNRFFNNRVQLNLEGFYWKYRNQQINHSGVDLNGNQGQFTENVGTSSIKGVEADLQVMPTRNTRLGGTIQYIDSKYDNYVYASPVGATPPLTGCPYAINPANAAQYLVNCSGRPGYQSPKWTVNLSAQQTIPLGDYQVVGSIDTQYKSSRYIAFDFLPQELVGPNWTTGAEMSFGPQSGSWSITGYVRNLENNGVPVTTPLYAAGSSLSYVSTAPRTYGIRASARF